MLRVVAANDFLAPGSGGAGVAIDRLFNRVFKLEFVNDVKIICYKANQLENNLSRLSSNSIYELWGGIPLPFWNNSDGLVLVRYKLIKKRLDEIRPNIIVIGSPTILTRQVAKYATLNNIPFIYISQTQPEVLFLYFQKIFGKKLTNSLVNYFQNLIFKVFSKAALFVFPTESSTKFLTSTVQGRLQQSKVSIISNGIDLEIFRVLLKNEVNWIIYVKVILTYSLLVD